ncbi:hypothetical protein [Alcaligenes parafaecalis]|uniref:Uncharacterized protein n=1 Tax=Alcaligenes parafaecalis TaxID=171260 RepID=A0ABT3VJ22_9BURK|nr:hypothetical protein [Alcaligenes parafaecalis]MCX5463494.1 hypothetical protein [Alcaligenes parafaecalis]
MDLTPATTLSLGLSRQRQHNEGSSWGGFPTRADGSFYDLSPHGFLGSDWEYLGRVRLRCELPVVYRRRTAQIYPERGYA